jgi:hypothetical protein
MERMGLEDGGSGDLHVEGFLMLYGHKITPGKRVFKDYQGTGDVIQLFWLKGLVVHGASGSQVKAGELKG